MSILRICLVTEIFHPEDQGGQGRQAFALARRMRARGALVRVATRRNFATSSTRDVLEGIAITRLPPTGLLKGRGWRAVAPTLWFLAALLVHLIRRRHDYDIILVQSVKAVLLPTLLASWLLSKRCVVKIDAVAELEQELTPESLAQMRLSQGSVIVRSWSRLRDALLRRADTVIAISAEIEAALARRLGPTARVVRIPNGLELDALQSTPGERGELRRRLGVPDGVLVTYTGRLSRAKGLPMLLQVWASIARRHPDAHLVLVGGGDRSFDGCETELRDFIAQIGLGARVTLTGHVVDVADYLRASDLFVLSSDSEGFGLSLVEAMAAGLPCISTAVGVAPEIISHGSNGWIVQPRSAEQLQTALETALTRRDEWNAIGAAARRAVTTRFDMEQVAQRYHDVFESLQHAPGAAISPAVLRRNASSLLACRIGADLLNFALFLIVSRHFGPSGVGAYAYGFAIAGFVYSAVTLGIDEYGIREYTRRTGSQRAALMADLLGSQACIAVVVVLALALYLLATTPTPQVLTIVLSLTVYQFCFAFAGTLFVPSMAKQRMVRPSLIILLCRAFGIAIAIPMILLGNASLQSAMLAFVLSGALMLMLAAQSAAEHGVRFRLHLSGDALRQNVRTLWSFAAADVMNQVFTRIGVIVLALRVSEHAAGLYAAGLKLVELACLPVLFLGRAAYPTLSQAFHDPVEFERASRQALWFGLLLALVSAVGLAAVAPPVLVPMLGPGYAGTEPIMTAMAAIMFVQGVEIVLGRLLLAANLSVARAAWISVGASICAALTIVAAPSVGLDAAIVAVVVAYLLVDVLYGASLAGALRRRSFAQTRVDTSTP